jgi:hypothetical protein
MMGTDRRRLLAGAALAALALASLGFLRDQTLLAAAWALALALVLARRRLWAERAAAGVAIALLVPWAVGLGPGGAKLVGTSADQLAKTRATLAIGARTAFPSTTRAPGSAAPLPGVPARRPPSTAAQAAVAAATSEQSATQGLDHLPVGLVDVGLRPFPWQATSGNMLSLARVETFGWYLLYALAAVGIATALRRRRMRLALQFPVLLTGMYLGIAALTQGNAGTAFRHREQELWALALAAAWGAQWLWSRRAERQVAGAPAAVEPREELPVLSGVDNSLSANGR